MTAATLRYFTPVILFLLFNSVFRPGQWRVSFWITFSLSPAAWASGAQGTGFGYLIPTVAGLVYFAGRKGTPPFTKPKLKWAAIGESCFNGSSEMVSQLATAVTTFLFNRTMMNLLGENGVAAITIIIYAQFLLNTLYIGYSMGIAPIIGFNYGRWQADGGASLGALFHAHLPEVQQHLQGTDAQSHPHVCRHTFCSNMAKSGMNPKTPQYLMGHSDIGVKVVLFYAGIC